MKGTMFSKRHIKEFIEIFDAGDYNIRFKIVHKNGSVIPQEANMTLNLSQIDNDAKKMLFSEIKKQGLPIKTDCYVFEGE